MSESLALAAAYDKVPYDSHPYANSHPDRLATVAALFGLPSASADRCRVLELGCAGGGNLLPMAVAFPESRFLGVELSAVQVQDFQQAIDALGLKNIEAQCRDILTLGEDLGTFDYIICHGVFSWVPTVVQEKILAICARHLAPDGIAYLSYNTYPGWHARSTTRDLMRYHACRFSRPEDRIVQARLALNFFRESVEHLNSSYSALLKEEADELGKAPDSYLLHEHLAEINEPIYFHQFVQRAAAHQLQYLSEADEVGAIFSSKYPAKVKETLRGMSSDLVQTEQFIDFLRNRRFRQSLLCHADRRPNRELSLESLPSFSIASALKPTTTAPSLVPGVGLEFRDSFNRSMSTANPAYKTALLHLGDVWPAMVPYPELMETVRDRIAPFDVDALSRDLLAGFIHDVVEFHLHPPRLTIAISERPLASPWARLQAAKGRATNLRHDEIPLDDPTREILSRLDGSNDREALLRALEGRLAITEDGRPIVEPVLARRSLEAVLANSLNWLARNAFLIQTRS